MTARQLGRELAVAGIGLATLGYASLVARQRARYGAPVRAPEPETLTLLDRFIPAPEVLEHHHIAINAPADVVMSSAKEIQLMSSPIIRCLFKARELALGGEPDRRSHPAALLAQMQSIGWVVLAETPCREIVLGAATMPWLANPVFRSIAPADFDIFREPGFVKIAWSLRVDPVDDRRSIFHTETRVSTTDVQARAKFRRYWSFVAPGVKLIRLAMLRPLKRAAERKARAATI